MRTTIALDDNVLEAAKDHARITGRTLGELIELAIRHELARQQEPRQDGPPLPTFTRGNGLRPGVDITSNRGLLEVLDEGSNLEDLR